MTPTPVLFDAPGPVMRRRIIIGSVVAVLFLAALAWIAVGRLVENGQFEAEKWEPFLQEEGMFTFLLEGLLNTLKAAAVAVFLALSLGIVLAVGRMSERRPVRLASGVVVEVLRGSPVLLLMLFFFLAFPILFDIDLPAFWSVVLALMLFNGAVICEIVRAGVNSLPRGQREAAVAIGLRHLGVLRYILLPQALRVMLPTLISQFVVLLKDTSLGFVIGYQELLQRSQNVQLLFSNPLQTFFLIALVYIAINLAVGKLSQWVGSRQRKSARRTTADVTRTPKPAGV